MQFLSILAGGAVQMAQQYIRGRFDEQACLFLWYCHVIIHQQQHSKFRKDAERLLRHSF